MPDLATGGLEGLARGERGLEPQPLELQYLGPRQLVDRRERAEERAQPRVVPAHRSQQALAEIYLRFHHISPVP
jgi:hypothetical protein